MGFRFRKSLTIVPGVRINLSKRGLSSASIGGNGLTFNTGRRGSRVTAGIPGTGLAFSQSLSSRAAKRRDVADASNEVSVGDVVLVLMVIGFVLWLVF